MQLLLKKTSVVTGASRGIGREIVKEFARHGSDVAFTYFSNRDKADELLHEIKKFNVKAKAYQYDASDLNQSNSLFDQVIRDFGNINTLVNNAGITKDGLILRMSEQAWDDVIDTNLKSVFNSTKASVRYFLKNRSGSIINISSIVGIKGNAGQSNYAASKSGIIGFTKSIALELGTKNVRCNAIAPGYIETDMTNHLSDEVKQEWKKFIPLKRSGQPIDVANTAVFLASELSSYVTGQVLQVDGGLLT